jgi:hypothetical protein
MPCSVTITSVIGLGPVPGSAATIRVTGTATDCQDVRVVTTCTAPGIAPVDANGNWQIDLQNTENCPCGARIYVHAECVADPNCQHTIPGLTLVCPEPTTTTSTTPPPTTTTTTTTTTSTTTTPPPCCYTLALSYPRPCSQGGNPVSVQFTLTITPDVGCPPYTGSVTWKVKQKVSGTWQVVQNVTKTGPGAASHTFPNFTPGDWGVEVILQAPTCQNDPLPSVFEEFPILNCDCPTFTGNLQATATPNPCVWNFSAPVYNVQNYPLTFEWDFGDGTTQTTNTSSTSHTYTTGGQMTVSVTVRTTSRAECIDTITAQITVDCGPGVSTTTTTSTTATPTTTSTTSTTPPPSTTPKPPTWGCLCTILLILALLFIALAAIAFLAWACGGFANLALLVFGIVCAVIGIVLLILWILICAAAACAALFVLIDIFTMLIVVMPIVAGILALLGLGNCGIGALINWGFFGIVLGILYRFGEIVGCIVRRS